MSEETTSQASRCAKCGSKARIVAPAGHDMPFVICSKQSCLQPGSGMFRKIEEAIRQWNHQQATYQ
jgi:hypothetical protein